MNKQNYGFIEPVIDNTHYVLGDGLVPQPILQPSGQWDNYLPKDEVQNLYGLETYNCTSFGTINAVRMLAKRVFDETWDKSQRALGVFAETRPPGNDPHIVCEAARKQGLVDQNLLPWTDDVDTIEEYFSLQPQPGQVINNARNWLSGHTLRHTWLWSNNPTTTEKIALIKKALQWSPVACSVSAWNMHSDGIYYDDGMPNNHWVVIFGWDDKGWKCYDSYNDGYDNIKTLDINFKINFAKRFYLSNESSLVQSNWIVDSIPSLKNWLNSLVNLLKSLTKTPMPQQNQAPVPTPEPTPEQEAPKQNDLLWGTPEEARHSCRVIMDTFSLKWTEKDLLCAVIQAESGFNTKAINHQTKDYGICQINEYWWIGPGKYFSSIDEVINNPEKSVKFMCEQYKAGHLDYWIAYKSGAYKKYL